MLRFSTCSVRDVFTLEEGNFPFKNNFLFLVPPPASTTAVVIYWGSKGKGGLDG